MKENISRYKELGDFLKTRRAKISPLIVGLPEGSRRRTPGLRREEVAALAGIGITWYTWLEQGRQIQVSAQVLESLARVLMLNDEETHHLYILANQTPPKGIPSHHQKISPMLQRVLDNFSYSPATILDSRWNIIAWNKAAKVSLMDFDNVSIENRNILWLTFTDPNYMKIYDNWELHAQEQIALFRAGCSKFIDDPWITQFVQTLKRESKEFDRWWSKHDVKTEKEYYKILNHPIVGKLTFEHTCFFVADNMNLKLFINSPVAETEIKMKKLIDCQI